MFSYSMPNVRHDKSRMLRVYMKSLDGCVRILDELFVRRRGIRLGTDRIGLSLLRPTFVLTFLLTFRKLKEPILGCIDADFWKQILTSQQTSRSTRFASFRTVSIATPQQNCITFFVAFSIKLCQLVRELS